MGSEITNIFNAKLGNVIVNQLVDVIVANRDYLSDIDGAIGDGDHGINMAKGFQLCRNTMEGKILSLDEAFQVLADALMEGIGGSMGPLYGSFFTGLAESISQKETLTKYDVADMLEHGLAELKTISDAQVGDKCLMDTLVPAIYAYRASIDKGNDFSNALIHMKEAAEKGKVSTIDLVAKIGRASRLGERSRGVQDAGATSCCLLLVALADGILANIE
ncbi:dihydroxyacetone kinase subunit DhaL [Thorsellia anophelis]|uniref:Dihydroxyacetone kinase DhaL subunit n=1 Tax=Thorsellia anophelis DSM 18579 TaxID=1123402 RepID=A0A1I0AEQ4_9GAMM|nr:dihydroxyacetone kinase subunit DhaL [Thorsellia anophelis]SES92298.1 dihydroxyacetone kinase DhaL subunit [Thorsellia anophelis DSM 18579]